MSQVLIFGASTTQGLWDVEGGWADRLKKFIIQSLLPNPKREIHIFNLGVAGHNSETILQRFESETKARLRYPKTLFIFNFGGNDSHFLHDKQTSRTSADIFSRNVTTLIGQAKKYSDLIVFVGINPVDESKTDPIPWETNVSFKNNLLKQYNDITRNICRKENIHFIEIFDELIKTDYKKFLEDGLHPNSEGHKKIFELVKNYLISHNIISSL